MSVLSCARRGCNNIMCDRLSNEYGYICHECFNELVASGIATDIEVFMDSNKRHNRNAEAIYAYYAKVFKEQDS